MKILLVAATLSEVKPFLSSIGWKDTQADFEFSSHHLTLLVTGVGMVATAFSLGKKLTNTQYDLALNLGIAGAFDRNFKLGEVVQVTTDQFPEMGAEDDQTFLSLEELGFVGRNEFPFKDSKIHSLEPKFKNELKKVSGITVNTVHGNQTSIDSIVKRLNPEVESMEGAAFFYACKLSDINCLQLRAISNYVEKRDKNKWEIGLALNNLAFETVKILKRL